MLDFLLKVWSDINPLKTYAGTPVYMAPEVTRLERKGRDKVGWRSISSPD